MGGCVATDRKVTQYSPARDLRGEHSQSGAFLFELINDLNQPGNEPRALYLSGKLVPGSSEDLLRSFRRTKQDITEIDLSRNRLGEESAYLLGELLKINTLRHVNLSYNEFGSSVLRAIQGSLIRGRCVTSLNLEACNLTKNSAGFLQEVMQLCPSIISMNLSRNALFGDSIPHSLQKSTALKHINVSDCLIENETFAIYLELFHKKVESFNISRNCLKADSMDALAACVRDHRCHNLCHLDLSENDIGSGVKNLCEGLKELLGLQTLSIAKCRLGRAGLLQIEELIARSSKAKLFLCNLVALDISSNSGDDWYDFSTLIRRTALQIVCTRDNKLLGGERELINAVMDNPGLLYLNADKTNVHSDILQSVESILEGRRAEVDMVTLPYFQYSDSATHPERTRTPLKELLTRIEPVNGLNHSHINDFTNIRFINLDMSYGQFLYECREVAAAVDEVVSLNIQGVKGARFGGHDPLFRGLIFAPLLTYVNVSSTNLRILANGSDRYCQGFRTFLSFLRKAPSLKTLVLSDNPLGDEAVGLISDALRQSPVVTVVLEWVMLTKSSEVEKLLQLPQLRYLLLSGNSLTDLCALSSQIVPHETLQYLDLSCNRFSDLEIMQFSLYVDITCAKLDRVSNLEEVCLAGNPAPAHTIAKCRSSIKALRKAASGRHIEYNSKAVRWAEGIAGIEEEQS